MSAFPESGRSDRRITTRSHDRFWEKRPLDLWDRPDRFALKIRRSDDKLSIMSNKLNIDEMSADEMDAVYRRSMKRIIWLNALWLLFVVAILIWKPAIGVILLILTGIKYYLDYRDSESQAHAAEFQYRTIIKRLLGKDGD